MRSASTPSTAPTHAHQGERWLEVLPLECGLLLLHEDVPPKIDGDDEEQIKTGKAIPATSLKQASVIGIIPNTLQPSRHQSEFKNYVGGALTRGVADAKRVPYLDDQCEVDQTFYNFCRRHRGLKGETPAMRQWVTDHLWSVAEVLRYRSAVL
jgi:hypothetical protein